MSAAPGQRRIALRVVCVAVLAAPASRWSATPDDCHALRKHGHAAPKPQKCYESLTRRARPVPDAPKATGAWRMYQEANNQFRDRGGPVAERNAMYRVRWGMPDARAFQ